MLTRGKKARAKEKKPYVDTWAHIASCLREGAANEGQGGAEVIFAVRKTLHCQKVLSYL